MKHIILIVAIILLASCVSASRSPIATVDVLLERIEALEARIAKLEGGGRIAPNDLLYRPMPGITLTPLDPRFFIVPNNGESK